ncbi:hypothetical protein [Chryseobacterium polytrichastri]|uniref:Uncharacterized protein n=1 Tax=Chryseobacterium polytrichastri TaxID=1302687 RepID=A0A1M7DHM0_9FLAO|nr:hypothetical protein [Chryseobacterium polytrichastri]SHL78965.1 hypothetical protein SAMN05444267_10251 [Chryseobacterium polytrichastri]
MKTSNPIDFKKNNLSGNDYRVLLKFVSKPRIDSDTPDLVKLLEQNSFENIPSDGMLIHLGWIKHYNKSLFKFY